MAAAVWGALGLDGGQLSFILKKNVFSACISVLFKKYLFINLVAPGVSCGRRAP